MKVLLTIRGCLSRCVCSVVDSNYHVLSLHDSVYAEANNSSPNKAYGKVAYIVNT